MSLLADLLSKIKQPQPTRAVPPNLKGIVQASAAKSAARRKIILVSVLIIGLVLSGSIAVFFINSLTDTSDIVAIRPQPVSAPETATDHRDDPVQTVRSTDTVQSGQEKGAVTAPPVKEHKKQSPAEKQTSDMSASDTVVTLNTEDRTVKPPPAVEETKNIDLAARDALLYKARASEMKQDYASSLATYKEVMDIDSDNVMVLNSMAYIYLKLGLIEESIQYALKAEELDADYTPALINIGIAYAQSGNVTAAEYYLGGAFKREPDNKSALFNLALLNEKKQNYAGAVEYFSRLSKLGDSAGILGLARIYEKQGRNSEALQLYKNLLLLESLDQQKRMKVKQRIKMLQSEAGKKVGFNSPENAESAQPDN